MKFLYYVMILILLMFLALPALSYELRVVSPYLGVIKNIYENSDQNLDLEDSSLMKGLYFQWINTERYQWNIFIYQSSDINFSTLWGGHFIFDYYYDVAEKHKSVIGVGFDLIALDMDAGDNITPLSDFELTNNIYVPFVRVGRYFLFGLGGVDISLLPWIGFEYELVRGKVSFIPPGPPVPFEDDIDSDIVFSLTGLNMRTVFYRFVEIEAKYSARFNSDDFLSDVSLMSNIYFTRKWALSYRFKYMENVFGSNRYHIWGLAYTF